MGPPVALSSSPVRPLFLRSDIAWTPEGDARGPGGSSASASSRSVSAVSSGYVPSRDMLGERILRDYESYMSGLRDGVTSGMVASPPGPAGGVIPRSRDAYRAGLEMGLAGAVEARALSVSVPAPGVSGSANPPEEEGVYELPPGVADRLAVGEALSAVHRRGRIKRRREDGSAEHDDVTDVTGSGSGLPRDDDADDGDSGAAVGGCSPT